jgi:release factor H-coupled RctB family protein
MVFAVGLPDLHPGRNCPVGAAWASKGVFYPHLIGNDIGCGMSLYKTSLKSKRIKLDLWVDNLHGLESPWEGDPSEWLKLSGVEPTEHDTKNLGTIGGGNHFAELQIVEEIFQLDKFNTLGLDMDHMYLLIHTGSRGFGEEVLKQHVDKFGYKGLIDGTEEATDYIKMHNWAMDWAKCNRELIANRFMNCLTGHNNFIPSKNQLGQSVIQDGSICILDIWHNCAIKKQFAVPQEDGTILMEDLWLHRKGAAPSDCGAVVIPGSRGTFSYLVEPSSDVTIQQISGFSLAHGAGRRLPRNIAFKKGENIKIDLTTTELGSKVICEKKDLLYEEIPEAYKDIDCIVEDLAEAGLIQVIAKFRPLITYKTRIKVYEKTSHFKDTHKDEDED